jgi:hypothetical protein
LKCLLSFLVVTGKKFRKRICTCALGFTLHVMWNQWMS